MITDRIQGILKIQDEPVMKRTLNVISLNSTTGIPSESRVIRDTSFFLFFTAPHPGYGIVYLDSVNRVKSGEKSFSDDEKMSPFSL